MFRAVKNKNGIILSIHQDRGQSGNYPEGSTAKKRQGVWCKWTFEAIPELKAVEGADMYALRFKENADKNGIELRSDEEVLKSPKK